jgi:hypothetical protein
VARIRHSAHSSQWVVGTVVEKVLAIIPSILRLRVDLVVVLVLLYRRVVERQRAGRVTLVERLEH